MVKFDIKQEADLEAEKAELHDFLRRFAAENAKVQKRLTRLAAFAVVCATLAAVGTIWNAVQIQLLSAVITGKMDTPQAPSASAPPPSVPSPPVAAQSSSPSPQPVAAPSPVAPSAPPSASPPPAVSVNSESGTSGNPSAGSTGDRSTADDASDDHEGDDATSSETGEDAPVVQIHEGEHEKDDPGSGSRPVDSTK